MLNFSLEGSQLIIFFFLANTLEQLALIPVDSLDGGRRRILIILVGQLRGGALLVAGIRGALLAHELLILGWQSLLRRPCGAMTHALIALFMFPACMRLREEVPADFER